MEKTTEEAVEIIERITRNDHQVQHDRSMVQKREEVSDSRSNEALLAQNKLFAQQVEELTKKMEKLRKKLREMQERTSNQIQQIACCELCGGEHKTRFCPPVEEEVNYIGESRSRIPTKAIISK